MAYDVFISHSSKDKNIAHAIVAGLENNKVRCFIAPRDINPGDDWISTISQTIINVPVMVLIFSENSNNSREVDNEINLAVNHNTVIIPFRIDETFPSAEKEYRLGNVHWLDAPDPLTDKQLQSLLDIIRPIINRKESEARSPDEPEIAKNQKIKNKPSGMKLHPKRIKHFRALLIAVVIAVVLIVSFSAMYIFKIGLFKDQGDLSAVETILELNFDDKSDINWLSNTDNITYYEGYIRIKHEGANINYIPENGFIYHARIRSTTCGGAALGPYRIDSCLNNPIWFDVVLDDDQLSIGSINMNGSAILNMGQWIDYILYTSPGGDRVYAIAGDAENNTDIAYSNYSIPGELQSQMLYPVFLAFFDENANDQFYEIDYVNISEGTLESYLSRNLPAYLKNKEKIDKFFSEAPEPLPELTIFQ